MGRTPRVERCFLASDPAVDRNLLHPRAKQQKSLRSWPWQIKVGCSKHRGLGHANYLPFPRENADQTNIIFWSALFWERPESCDFHNCVQSPFHLLQRSGSGTRSWPKGAGNMFDWAVSCVCFPFTFFLHISTSKSINWIPGLVSICQ